jgi:hypothetical protein
VTGELLLCILPAGQPPGTDSAGSAGPALEGLVLHSLTLWIRSAPQPPAPTLEEVRAHHAIVADAWSRFPAVLPVRFGEWFATRGELMTAVEPKVPEYESALTRVAGMGEFSIRILDPALAEAAGPEPATATRGTAYLRAALERTRARERAEARGRSVAAQLREALGSMIRDERIEPLPSPHGLVMVAHLIAREREAEYEAAAARFAESARELRFLRTGPWPPWSFTT